MQIANWLLLLNRQFIDHSPLTGFLSGPNNFCIGNDTSDLFSEEIEEKIRVALETNEAVSVDNCSFQGGTYNFKISSLSENFSGQGVVMSLEEC